MPTQTRDTETEVLTIPRARPASAPTPAPVATSTAAPPARPKTAPPAPPKAAPTTRPFVGGVDLLRAQQPVDGKDAYIVSGSVGRVLHDDDARRLQTQIYDDGIALSAKVLAEVDRRTASHPSVGAARAKVTNVRTAIAQTKADIDRTTKELRTTEEKVRRAISSGQVLPYLERRVTELTASLAALERRKSLLEPSLTTADADRSKTESAVRETIVGEALSDLRAVSLAASERISAAAVWSELCAHTSLMRAIQEIDPFGERTRPPGQEHRHARMIDATVRIGPGVLTDLVTAEG